MKAVYNYVMPFALNDPSDRYNIAANIALFLVYNKQSIYGRFSTRMKADDQRKLLGRFMGKGTLVFRGDEDAVHHQVKVDFGHDTTYSDSIVCRENRL